MSKILKTESFGSFIRKHREAQNLPLRKVALDLNIDLSTLSKIERGQRIIPIECLNQLSKCLNIELKEVHIRYLVDRIIATFGNLEFFPDGVNEIQKLIQKQYL